MILINDSRMRLISLQGAVLRELFQLQFSSLPDNPRLSKPWYVMPLALPFSVFIEGKNFSEIIEAFIPLAETLEQLHMQGIYHRDIKPDNFLYFSDRLYLTDFGLVKFPESGNLTPERRDVGAKLQLAPEMRRYCL